MCTSLGVHPQPSYTPGPIKVKCRCLRIAQIKSRRNRTVSYFQEVLQTADTSHLQHSQFYIRGQSDVSEHKANNPSLILSFLTKIKLENPKFQFQIYCPSFYMAFNKSHRLFSLFHFIKRILIYLRLMLLLIHQTWRKLLDYMYYNWQNPYNRIYLDFRIMKYANPSYSSQSRKHTFEVCALLNSQLRRTTRLSDNEKATT